MREQDFAITADEHFSDQIISRELGLMEVLLAPRSRLVGHAISEVRFCDK